jgi:hypothetical protein
MTFSINYPNAAESPGLFPAQGNTNFSRLKTIIEADHQFNDTVAGDDGFHNHVSYINRPIVPSIPAGANAIGYTLNVGLGSGTNRDEAFVRNAQTNMLIGNRAYAVFEGRSTNGNSTIDSSFNVTTIERYATGKYKVTMPNALASEKYAVFFSTSDPGLYPTLSLTIPKTTTIFEVWFYINGSGTLVDPFAGIKNSLLVYGG